MKENPHEVEDRSCVSRELSVPLGRSHLGFRNARQHFSPPIAVANRALDSGHLDDLLTELAEATALDDLGAIARTESAVRATGATMPSHDQVQRQHPEALASLVSTRGSRSSVAPLVDRPVQSNIRWTSTRTTVTYNSKKYELQTLTASPTTSPSALVQQGSGIVLKGSGNWKAGTVDALRVVGTAAAGSSTQTLIAVTLYDAARAFANGMKTTTIVKGATATYSWDTLTTVKFVYVKPHGKSDSYQQLSYIATKVTAGSGYLFSKLTYSKDSKDVVVPKYFSGSRVKTFTPSCYSPSSANIVRAYLGTTGVRSRCDAAAVKVTGINGKTVVTTYPVSPAFPAQLAR